MSICDFQNLVRKNENDDFLKALRAMSFLDSETVEGLGWFPWG